MEQVTHFDMKFISLVSYSCRDLQGHPKPDLAYICLNSKFYTIPNMYRICHVYPHVMLYNHFHVWLPFSTWGHLAIRQIRFICSYFSLVRRGFRPLSEKELWTYKSTLSSKKSINFNPSLFTKILNGIYSFSTNSSTWYSTCAL